MRRILSRKPCTHANHVRIYNIINNKSHKIKISGSALTVMCGKPTPENRSMTEIWNTTSSHQSPEYIKSCPYAVELVAVRVPQKGNEDRKQFSTNGNRKVFATHIESEDIFLDGNCGSITDTPCPINFETSAEGGPPSNEAADFQSEQPIPPQACLEQNPNSDLEPAWNIISYGLPSARVVSGGSRYLEPLPRLHYQQHPLPPPQKFPPLRKFRKLLSCAP